MNVFRWVALKFPGGDAFAYMDSNGIADVTGKLVWALGYDWAATHGTALAETLQQLYRHDEPVSCTLGLGTYTLTITCTSLHGWLFTEVERAAGVEGCKAHHTSTSLMQ